jgi:hypothetical protein
VSRTTQFQRAGQTVTTVTFWRAVPRVKMPQSLLFHKLSNSFLNNHSSDCEETLFYFQSFWKTWIWEFCWNFFMLLWNSRSMETINLPVPFYFLALMLRLALSTCLLEGQGGHLSSTQGFHQRLELTLTLRMVKCLKDCWNECHYA